MICRVLAIITLLALSSPLLAQSVTMRSGEHADFSRLVLDMPTRLNWEVSQDGAKAKISFENSKMNVDIAAVFDKIPRDRLASIAWDQETQSLNLQFGCTCEVEAFWSGETMLVFDIKEGAVLAEPEPTNAEPQTAAPKKTIKLPAFPAYRSAEILKNTLPEIPPAQEGQQIAPPSNAEQNQNLAIADTRDRLLKQFGRAASQGLLSPRRTLPSPGELGQKKEAARQTTESAPSTDTKEPAKAQINLKAQSSMDRDFLSALVAQSAENATNGCLPNHQVDVASWGTDEPFGDQISAVRLNLTGEFDQINPDSVVSLAKLYLYFGFGAEARQVLKMLPEKSTDTQILGELSQIAEHDHVSEGTQLLGQMDCESVTSLWSALAYESLPRDLPIDTDAITRAFNSLPKHLRLRYGPILSRRLLDAGSKKAAERIMRILDRPDDVPTPEINLAKAQIDMAEGNTKDAETRLASVVESSTEHAAEALIQAIEGRISRGEDVSFEQAQLAGAYSYELQDEELGPMMKGAYIRALAASGSVDEAFKELSDENLRLSEEAKSAIQTDLMRILGSDADDMTFLKFALAPQKRFVTKPETTVTLQVAQRLFDLGFPVSAQEYLETLAQNQASTDRVVRLLRARIALAQDKPRQAIVELLDYADDEANMIRAQALSAAGDHASSYLLYAAGGHEELARQEAWLREDWENAADPDQPVYGDLSNLISHTSEDSAPPEQILARNKLLVEESDTARATVQALLAANPPIEE